MKLTKQTKSLLLRTVILLALFILFSGIIGSWIIGTKLLFGFYFFIYGNLGKLVIFSTILFVLIARGSLSELRTLPFTKQNYSFFAFAGVFLGLFFVLKEYLLTLPSFHANVFLSLTTHAVLLLMQASLVLGVFGLPFVQKFVRTYKKELGICLSLSIVLFFAIFQVWKLWPYLSEIVLQSEYFLFSKMFDTVYVIPPRGLFVESFVVEIAEACSGLESIFLFTVLYIVIVILDWKKLALKRVMLLFPILLTALVVVNILRVFLLILIGILINPQIMAALFHTYLGLILFVIFFLCFMKYVYPFLRIKANA